MLYVTVAGVYEMKLNGERVGDYVLAPGWTVYDKRHQYQEYNVTEMLRKENILDISVGNGWYRMRSADWMDVSLDPRRSSAAVIAQLEITYEDNRKETIISDCSWLTAESKIRFCDLYDGEVYDSAFEPTEYKNAVRYAYEKDQLIKQEGEIIKEQERIKPIDVIISPKGEKIIDFGQNLTGYVEFSVNAKKGDMVEISHAEILDADGNFYTENYRSAKAQICYYCKNGRQTHKPSLTFFGFRYIRLDEFPGELNPQDFTAIVVHSDMKRTGMFHCSNMMLNRLYRNIIRGQKSNFLDVPTDCPQRDERLGWTGDAQVFALAASYNYDVECFFAKWLNDLKADQGKDGYVPRVIPNILQRTH